MERTVRRGEPQTYAQAVGDLWEGVGTALVGLERIADSRPDSVVDDFVDELPSLQYSLHSGAELAVGIEPPTGAEELHEELVAALAEARDATAEIALALEAADGELVEPLLPEWRGVLFRVRLARLRVLERSALRRSANAAAPTPRRARRERTSASAGPSSSPPARFSLPGRCGPQASRSSPADSSSTGRNPATLRPVHDLMVARQTTAGEVAALRLALLAGVPRPTDEFRRRAWLDFRAALRRRPARRSRRLGG